jgi:hypothetical protein
LWTAKVDWACLYVLDWHYPAITAARQSFDVSGLVRGITECYPKSLDSRIDTVFELDDRIVWPEPLPNLAAQHNLTRMAHQHCQNLKRLLRQLDSFSVFAQFS